MGKSTFFCPSSCIFFLLWSPVPRVPPPGRPPYFRSLSSAALVFVLTYFKVCSQHRNPTSLKFQDASPPSPHPLAPPSCKTKALTPPALLVISMLTADSRASWASTAPVSGQLEFPKDSFLPHSLDTPLFVSPNLRQYILPLTCENELASGNPRAQTE